MLYVPDEGPIMCDSEAHKNKEFVQRMEGTLFIIIIIIMNKF